MVKTNVGVNPEKFFRLVKFDVKNDNGRYLPNTKAEGSLYGVSARQLKENEITIGFKKLAGNIYEISPTQALQDGEYDFLMVTFFIVLELVKLNKNNTMTFLKTVFSLKCLLNLVVTEPMYTIIIIHSLPIQCYHSMKIF
jgi:hypothetical protein